MPKKLIPVAIAYDFDGTLAPGNMQEHSFLADIGKTPAEFWAETKALAKKQDMDEILSYMWLMLNHARSANKSVQREGFVRHGKTIRFFEGVEGWFDRINAKGKEHGVKVEHYIISSGMRELIEGTSIAKHFEYIFASGYMYDADGIAIWPALGINYTNKTQHLFRINKGIINSYENSKINKVMPDAERPVPFSNMIYIGDGETDIPAMKMLKYQGGHSIAVYDKSRRKTKDHESAKTTVHQLLEQGRADYALPADYREGEPLDRVVSAIIERVALNARLKNDQKQ